MLFTPWAHSAGRLAEHFPNARARDESDGLFQGPGCYPRKSNVVIGSWQGIRAGTGNFTVNILIDEKEFGILL